jgi:hypothetical protein
MAVASKPPVEPGSSRRIWKTPGSVYNWLFLAGALFLLGCIALIYRSAITTQQYPGPSNDPLREFGIVAFALVLLVAAYTLRRRFVRTAELALAAYLVWRAQHPHCLPA